MKPVILILLLTLAVASFPAGEANGGSIIYIRANDAITLDPGKTSDIYSSEVIVNIFEGLVRFKKNSLDVEPCLATSWESQADGLHWVFRLRRGVRFHNGQPFNATAVVYSFRKRQELKETQFLTWGRLFQSFDSISALDEFTVAIILKAPSAYFLTALALPSSYIVPPGTYEEKEFTPVGTGPFRLGSWSKNSHLTLLRNPAYWEGAPGIGQVVFKMVGDSVSRLSQLRTGSADVGPIFSSREYDEISRNREIGIMIYPSLFIHYMMFNTRRPPFNQLAVRQAFSHLLNQRNLVKVVFQNFADAADTVLPAAVFPMSEPPLRYEFDLEKARRLLARAGYAKGFSCSLYFGAANTGIKQIAERLVRNARSLNIRIRVFALPFAQLLRDGAEGKHDLLLMGWTDAPDPDFFLRPLCTMDKGNLNFSFYHTPALDSLLRQGRETLDKEKRRQIYLEILKTVHAEMFLLPLYHIKNFVVFNRRISGLATSPLGYVLFKEAGKKAQ